MAILKQDFRQVLEIRLDFLVCRMTTNMVNIDKEKVRQIVHYKLNMIHFYGKMVPENLNSGSKNNQTGVYFDILRTTK